MSAAARAIGRCTCEGVVYEVRGPLRPVINCHCWRCRRSTGHFMAATAAARDDLVLLERSSLQWYDATDQVQYGFCRRCGSTLFWRASDKPDHVSIAAGTLDPPTGLTTEAVLFTDSASDYHRLDEEIPEQHRGDDPAGGIAES